MRDMKISNALSVIAVSAAILNISSFILHGGFLYLILGCLWVIIGIRRFIKHAVMK